MPALVPLHNTWGAVFIGVLLGVFLYGILTLQVYMYYQHYPKDNRYLKSVVGLTWILDTLHTIFVTHMVYTYLVSDFGDYASLQFNTWSFNLHVLTTTLVAAISQTFFIHRCWKLDRGKLNTVFSAVILLVAGIQFGFGLTCTALTFMLDQYIQFLNYTWAVDTWLGSAATCDILVSAAIVRSLWMSRTGVTRTNNLIMRLVLWTVNTGIITSMWAILDIALFTASQDTLIHDFFNVMLAKLYANSLLATLNNRRPTISYDEEFSKTQSISLTNVARSHAYSGRETDTKLSGVHIMTHTIQETNQPTRALYKQPEPSAWTGGNNKAQVWVEEESVKSHA